MTNGVNSVSRLFVFPGLNGTGELLEDFVSCTPDSFAAEVVNYPSEAFENYDQLYERVAARLPTDEKFVVLGESFSGPLSIRIAHARPPGLHGVVLCNSFARAPRCRCWGSLPWSWIFAIRPPRFLMHFACAGAGAKGTLIDALYRMRLSVPPGVLAQRLHEVFRADVCRELSELTVPILYLRGTCDRLVPNRAVELIRQTNDHVSIATFEAPHLLLQTCPEEAWAAIAQFFEEN